MCKNYNDSCKQEELGCQGCAYNEGKNEGKEVDVKCGKE